MTTDGLTAHQLRSALSAARVIDEAGNPARAVHRAYGHAVTQGAVPSEHLKLGEKLLLDADLLDESGGRLSPTDRLARLVQLDDTEALAALAVVLGAPPQLARMLATHRDDSYSSRLHDLADLSALEALGAAGEELVVQTCKEELENCQRGDLAQLVQRVSLISDALGYDVVAPALTGQSRLLEVKTQSGAPVGSFRFYITRNEYEVGRSAPRWALVACNAPEGPYGPINIVGWCRTTALRPYLPDDRNGYWTEALVRLPIPVLAAGLPDLA